MIKVLYPRYYLSQRYSFWGMHSPGRIQTVSTIAIAVTKRAEPLWSSLFLQKILELFFFWQTYLNLCNFTTKLFSWRRTNHNFPGNILALAEQLIITPTCCKLRLVYIRKIMAPIARLILSAIFHEAIDRGNIIKGSNKHDNQQRWECNTYM